MIKFYLKLQSRILSKALLLGIIALIVLFNIAIRLEPGYFIPGFNRMGASMGIFKVIPTALYSYCDVYLLLIFIILVYFSIGADFYNKMGEITLAIGGSKTNIFMLKKFLSLFVVYVPLYLATYINIYTLYISGTQNGQPIPFSEVFLYSVTANIFVIVLALFILFLTRDIPVSLVLILSYYLIEEHLWRAKITRQFGILGHIYSYYESSKAGFIKIKMIYLIFSIVLAIITLKLAGRERRISPFNK